ncbi:MAG: phage capsid protein [Ferrovibrio sp.]|uniref:phage capsid protein n=1 Tax=Ferrovibrio sp. TaxID=1917215 RepID=UPI00391D8127
MANATVSRLGQSLGAGDTDALFLKQFAGETLATFDETNVFMDKHLIRNITSGKSAQFPVLGTNTAGYHTPGTEITGKVIKHAEKVITIDDLLISDAFIANIDEAKNHYEVRSHYTGKCGHALAVAFDKNVAQVGVLAARASATITGVTYGGSVLTHANYATDGDQLASGIFLAMQRFDEKDVPENERYAFVRPAQYYLLVQTTKVINRDWGGAGVYADGKVLKVAGAAIVKSNHIPSTDIDSGPTAYRGDFTKTVALVMQKEAVGTVKLLDLAVESAYDIRRQGTLMVAKYAMGHGILRPECAVELAEPAS